MTDQKCDCLSKTLKGDQWKKARPWQISQTCTLPLASPKALLSEVTYTHWTFTSYKVKARIKYLFSDVYDVSDLQLQLILVLWLIVKQRLALSPLRLCERWVNKHQLS